MNNKDAAALIAETQAGRTVRHAALEARWTEIDAWVTEVEQQADDVSESDRMRDLVNQRPPTAAALAIGWLRFATDMPAWTAKGAATVLSGLSLAGPLDTSPPNIVPAGTSHPEGGEPAAATASERVLQPAALRQREAGPCPSRLKWRRDMARTVNRLTERLESAERRGALLGDKPADFIAWALANDVTPPWLAAAEDDPELAERIIPPVTETGVPAAPALAAVLPPHLPGDESQHLDSIVLTDGDRRSLPRLAHRFGPWSHFLVFAKLELRPEIRPKVAENRRIADALNKIIKDRSIRFDSKKPAEITEDTVSSWRSRYFDVPGRTAYAVRRFRALGLENPDAPADLPDLDTFLATESDSVIE